MVLRVEEKRSLREGESRLRGGSRWAVCSTERTGNDRISAHDGKRFRNSAPSFLKEERRSPRKRDGQNARKNDGGCAQPRSAGPASLPGKLQHQRSHGRITPCWLGL